MGPILALLKKPQDIGLLIKRLVVFALPALVIVAAIMGNIFMGAIAEKPTKKEETVKATPVVVANAIAENVTLSVTTQGEARPRTQIEMAPNISGRIAYVSPNFIEGGAFKKGDTLIAIEDDEFRFRVTQAEAAVAQANSRFASEQAEKEAALRELDELGIVDRSPLARREPQMAEVSANLASAKAALREAKLQLARTKIIAPFDGRVTERMADIGEFVSPGNSIGRIFSTEIMEIRLPFTDEELGQLGLTVGYSETPEAPGPRVSLRSTVAGQPGIWEGRIVRTEAAYDPQTRVLFAYAAVEDPYGNGASNGVPLAAGLFVTAEVMGKSLGNTVVIPRAAMRGDGEVYVARDDRTLEIRKVRVAKSDRERAVITAGLQAGERVITSPVRGVANGMTIAIAGDPEPSEQTRLAEDTQS